MDILSQCQIWNDNEEYQNIIDAIEAIPENKRTPELDSELARAYNNIAELDDIELYKKALELLKPHAEYFEGDHCWNFRMAYAYYFLGWEDEALYYFEKALEARPGDKDTEEFINECLNRLTFPRFNKNFRTRVAEAWEAFQKNEPQIRHMVDLGEEAYKELLDICDKILNIAFSDIIFEIGFNGEKYELVLIPDGEKAKLFAIMYFKANAPACIFEKWNIIAGRQMNTDVVLRFSNNDVSARDVRVWIEHEENNTISISLYCKKLMPAIKENKEEAWYMLSCLTDRTIGEITAMNYITGFNVLEEPPESGYSIVLSELPQVFESKGIEIPVRADEYIEKSYMAYSLEPINDPNADWRFDVFAGSTNCPAFIDGYIKNYNYAVDTCYKDGIAAGFLCYPIDSFNGDDRSEKILSFRETLEAAITEHAGKASVTFIGGASGLFCGYLDFIAWDLEPVLEAAVDFFKKSNVQWAIFHSFRRDVGAVRLINKTDDNSEDDEFQTEGRGSLLGQKEIDDLEAFVEGNSGYYYQMLEYLENFIKSGVNSRTFTERQAKEDLQIALWYAYACLNIDQYEYYYKAAQLLPYSEKNAKNCGMWYYRYSVALMYCGRVNEALSYAEAGTNEEPDYPWIWLQVGKLRSYFGDYNGALEAVKNGLEIVPGDHEFLTLHREILEGASLEQMEYHWIDPESDKKLQLGLDMDSDEKLRAISCIVINHQGFEKFIELFNLHGHKFDDNEMYCNFKYNTGSHDFDMVFRMNKAGLSKLNYEWIVNQKEIIDSGIFSEIEAEGKNASLNAVLFDLDYSVSMIYKLNGANKYYHCHLTKEGNLSEPRLIYN